jgi:hypothetical protein
MSTTTRADLACEALLWTSIAAEAKARADAARKQLEDQARTEWERDGVAPTWKIPGVGTVPLALSQDRIVVADPTTYTTWVARTYPTEVEQTTTIRPAFDEAFRAGLIGRGDPPCLPDGTVVPGLIYAPGGTPRGVSIRPTGAAKTLFAAEAAARLDKIGGLR